MDTSDDSQAAELLEMMGDPDALDPAQESESRETSQQVAAALMQLDGEHRCVLVLRDVEGLAYQDIADVLELAVGTVKSRIFRARLALRKLMEGAPHRETA